MPSLDARIDTTRTWKAGWLISLSGEIGPWDALLADEALLDAFDQGALSIVVDLSDVASLDRVAVRILLEAGERQRAAGGEVFIARRDTSRLGYRIRPVTRSELKPLRRLAPRRVHAHPLGIGNAGVQPSV